MEVLFGFVLGAVVAGGGALWLLRRSSGDHSRTRTELVDLRVEHAHVQTRLEDHDEQLAEVAEERDDARTQLEEAEQQLAEAKTELATVTADHQARQDEMAKAREELDVHFRGIASEVVQSSSEEFLRHANEQFREHTALASKDLEAREQAVSSLVQPVRERLQEFEQHVSAIENRRTDAYAHIDELVKQTQQQISNLHAETGRLREALHSSQVRGSWGEQQLLNVVEAAGMRQHIDFVPQETVAGEDGNRRPDLVVNIPGGVRVVIDAKTPFDAYFEAQNATTEQERDEFLHTHAESLIGHARDLQSRDYQRWIDGSPDFVVMFVGADGILDAAQRVRPTIWEDAWRQHRVLISTPGLLVAFLRTVAQAWQQEDTQQNALQIAEAARELYLRLGTYAEHVNNIGRGLGRAVDAYNRSVGSFQSRVLVQARRMEELGAIDGDHRIQEPEQLGADVRELTAHELRQEPELELELEDEG